MSGNVDPLLGDFWSATSTISLSSPYFPGAPLVPQPGWGGGPNVSLGCQPGVVWGLHSTPSTAATTGAVTVASPAPPASPAAVAVSFALGCGVVNATALPGPAVATPSPGAYVPSNTLFSATFSLQSPPPNAFAGAVSASTSAGTLSCLQYVRIQTYGAFAGWNYTSPVLCRATLAGLNRSSPYTFTLSATASIAAGSGGNASSPARNVSYGARAHSHSTARVLLLTRP